jgi:hypothetical protein
MIRCTASPRWFAAAVAAAAVGALLLGWDLAEAQTRKSQDAEPNVFARVGHWFDQSFGRLNGGMQQTFAGVERFGDRSRDAFKQAAADATASAESSLAPPRFRVISERHRCKPAANGAPDCQQAAEAACHRHGYAKGSSLQTQSERKCALPRLFSQASVKCHTETHVLRALCQ